MVGILGTGRHSMGKAGVDSTMVNYVMPNTTQIKSCDSAPISGCSGSGSGQTTSCPSGQYWNGSACVSSTTTSCPSGQYWNGSSCVNTSTTDCTSGQYWNGSACVDSSTSPTPTPTPSPTSSSCGSDQYWDTRTNSCQSMQSACAEAGGTWDSATNYCRMPSSSADAKPLAFLCPSGHDWNGSYCVLKHLSGVEMYVANVLSAFMSLIGF